MMYEMVYYSRTVVCLTVEKNKYLKLQEVKEIDKTVRQDHCPVLPSFQRR